MAQVKICLRTIICNKDFSMLNRVHGSRIHIDIRIKLLHGDLDTACLQKSSKGSCCNTFSKTRYNTTCYKYILNHLLPPSIYTLAVAHFFAFHQILTKKGVEK